MKSRIWLSLAHMGGREQEFVKEAFDTNWIVPLGPNVDAFEQDLRDYLGGDCHVVALSSGTAAIHLGLVLLGVQTGDEVICQSFTFAATANPITYLGATPIFVDSEEKTWNMDPVLLEKAIQDRLQNTGKLPKAILPVHLYGMPAQMGEIEKIACKYNIPVLEDAAEALGSEFEGKKCGVWGNLGVLSFNGNKIITTSGGGALICRSKEEADKVKFYATQARDNAPHYQHSHIGYNYRLSNVCAGIGRGQMYVLKEHVERRRAIHDLYVKLLSGVKGIRVVENPDMEYASNFWLTTILVNPDVSGITRENVRLALEADNIESRPLWKPMHLQPVFAKAPSYTNGVSEQLFDIGLCLPSGSTLTDNDIERIVGIITQIK